jgi:hypothetical protein
MPTTFNLIEKRTLASTSATVVFTSIPQTYDDLMLIQSAKVNRTSGAQFGYTILNNNAAGTTSYLYNGIWMSPSTSSTWNGPTSESGPYMNFWSTTANWESNAFGTAETWFPNYRGSTRKQTLSLGGNGYNATGSTDSHIMGLIHLDTPTTAALTSIQLETDGNYYHIGTQFWLYGINNS